MSRYRGRFAPSPTGPLHFGSLFAAVISYLHARYHQGTWLLRIEDIDPPREQPDARQMILDTLSAHGLNWDGPVTCQSDRYDLYRKSLSTLTRKNLCYHCPCSRKYLASHQGIHLPECITQTKHSLAYACKFKAKGKIYRWIDGIQGQVSLVIEDDFVLQRKDLLYAYQLAVVSDDIAQGITQVVRGFDLLDSTPMQLAIYQGLAYEPPLFSHFPVIVDSQGQKLSKQNLATAVDNNKAIDNLLTIFKLLDIRLSRRPASTKTALEMALNSWGSAIIPALGSIQGCDTPVPGP